MENGFLAKSTGETIIEHTENLIENFILLMKLYPNIKVNKKLLLLACIYHDLGKINKKFQGKLFGKRDESEIPHGVLSTAFINSKNLIKNQNFDKYDLKILAHAVALHHERDISEIEDDDFEKEIELMNNETENFINSLKKLEKEYKDYFEKDNDELVEKSEIFNIQDNNIKLKKLSEKYYKLGERLYSVDVSMSKEEAEEIFSKYIMLKGLLNKIDYAASSGLKVEYKNNFLEKSMENFLQNILKKYNSNNNWNDLQKFMIKNRDKNVIVVAQTGFGKTEAGLLWIGNNKGFFTLPLRVAINSIYKRIEEQIIQGDVTNKFGILHSDFRSEYLKNLENNKKDKNIQKNMTEDKFDEYINKTKQLSLPLTVCTIDQLFDFVYRAAGFELKVAILSYSKIVIDEIQMYSSELVASLIFGIKYITDFGGKFAIMTATLPGVIKTLLEKENIPFITTEPFINNDIRHKVKVENKEINAEFIKEKYKNNKILVVCNTVRKSKEIYNKLKEMGIPDDEINLLHSQFIKKDRAEKEAEISKFADPKRFTENIKKEREIENIRENGIWIGTQVLEASLDLDFDVLITELSDLNGLFQRMGRCYRKRIIRTDEEYNCYVFIENCSGIGSKKSIIDETIHEKSREKLVNIDGILTEKEKLSLIDDVYSYESLKESKYFQLINEKLYTLKDYIVEYDIKKEEVRKIFRNIRSIEIIPKRVYDDNAEMINEKIEILKRTYKDLSQEEKEKLKLEKIKARDKINQLKVNIPEYEFDKSDYEFLKINNYESIIILNCDYSYERGVEILKQEKKKDFEDLCF
jgi:CRISPR-associated helicase cas3